MVKTNFLIVVFLSAFFIGCSSTPKGKNKKTVTNIKSIPKKKLNVLFIAIDDLKPTIGAYGDTYAMTPNIDKFSENATVFMNNQCQWAVCGPSRASLMTGKRPDYTKVRDLKTRMRDVNPNIVSIPQHFKNNGYFTAGVGKIYDPRCIDKQIDKFGWSIPFYKENKIPYPEAYGQPVFGYYQNKKIKKKIANLIAKARAKGVKKPEAYVRKRFKPPYEISNAPDEAYTDGAIRKKGIELIDEVSNQEKPFFLAIGFKRPHLPFVAPKKYWDMYDANKVPFAKFQHKSKNGPDLAYHQSNELQSYKDPENIEYKLSKEDLLLVDKEVQRKLIHGYYACTSFVDTQLGKVFAKLKEKGLDKNTIVILWGDHGWHLGDHSLWNKHSNFEQATRSPMMIYTPNSKKGIKISSPTEFVDIFPTLCELAGIETPKNLDGMSLATLVNGTTKRVKNVGVTQISRGKKMGYSFRNDRYRYTVWVNNKVSTDKVATKDFYAEELYDYKTDPLEKVNHINEVAYASVKKEMTAEALKFFREEYQKNN